MVLIFKKLIMIEFKDISFSYKKGKGVTNLNLKLEDGEFNFLIGPTGSGKTTLMRLIYFDLIPDSGTLIVNGFKSRDLSFSKTSKVRKEIGMVFQDYKLLNDRNVYDNISLPVSYTHLTLPTT